MRSHIVYPDYGNCTLGTVSSLLRYYGAAADHPALSVLDAPLKRGPKTVVLMIFDGMGEDMLERNLPPDAFLRRHRLHTLTSVFPSTTTAAMTSYYSGLSPARHGWLGWTLYFKEFGGIIETYMNRFDGTKLSIGERSAAYDLMPFTTIFEKIHAATGGMPVHFVAPEGIGLPENPARVERYNTLDNLCEIVRGLCSEGDDKFVFAYCPEPDHAAHQAGCAADETRSVLSAIDERVEALCGACGDTLFLISADHGLADMEGYILLNEVPRIDECLLMPPSIESRAASLFAKPGMRRALGERFQELYGDKFLLMTREEVFDKKLFGPEELHKKADDFVGDYLACATGNIGLRYKLRNGAPPNLWKGQHGGLTAPEMLVPLIAIQT